MIKEFVIGLLVFGLIASSLLMSANDINNAVPGSTSIDSQYLNDQYYFNDTRQAMGKISDNAPGGNASQIDPSSTSSVDLKQGYRSGALIFSTTTIFKKLMGGNSVNSSTSLENGLLIKKDFLNTAVAIVLFSIAIALISSILLNPIR